MLRIMFILSSNQILFQTSIFVLCHIEGKGENASSTNFPSSQEYTTNFLPTFYTSPVSLLGPASVYTMLSFTLFYLKLFQWYSHDICIFIFPPQVFYDKVTEPSYMKMNRLWEETGLGVDRNLFLVLRE